MLKFVLKYFLESNINKLLEINVPKTGNKVVISLNEIVWHHVCGDGHAEWENGLLKGSLEYSFG